MIGGCPRGEDLPAFHDGGAPSALRGSVERHLLECRECADRLAQMEAVDALLLRSRPHPESLDAGEAQALFQRAVAASGVSTRSRGWGSWRWQWRIAGLAAAGIAVSVLAHGRGGSLRDIARGPARAEPPVPSMSAAPAGLVRERSPLDIEPELIVARQARPRPQWVAYRRKRARRGTGFHPRRNVLPEVQPADTAPAELETEETVEPVLVVNVTNPPVLNLTVTEAAAELPGFARAEAVALTPTGSQVLTAVTVSTCTVPSVSDGPDASSQEPLQVEDEKENLDEKR